MESNAFMLMNVYVYVSVIAAIALAFFQTTVLTVLFFHVSKEAPAEETEEEDFVPPALSAKGSRG